MRDRPGYDLIIQAMGGLMSLTGEPEGSPMKVGVAVSDIAAGLFAVVAILAALQARHTTGEGQRLDISLFDSQLAWLGNIASGYLLSGILPQRYGNAHANIVPYQTFRASDQYFVLAVGNDSQFARLCALLERTELAADPRFRTNQARVTNQQVLIPMLESLFGLQTAAHWLAAMDRLGIPSGPIHSLDQVFAEPQVQERQMLVTVAHPTAGQLPLVASPIRMSETPVVYGSAPPRFGEHTDEVLQRVLGLTSAEVQELHRSGAIS
jgi:formyl-CoA transferase